MHMLCRRPTDLRTAVGPELKMLAGFLFLLLLGVLTDGESVVGNCSYQEVLKSLKLKENTHAMTLPVKNHSKPLEVTLDILIYAILDVNEKEQKFISYVWVDMLWTDEFISWDPDQFCGIRQLILPTKHLWKPDLTIEEMTEKDKASQSPFLSVNSAGGILLRNDMMVSSTCKMRVYKFPFDIQSCNLSFKSVIHSAKEMTFVQLANSESSTEWSRAMMRSQSEWRFINMEIFNKTVNNFGITQNELVCKINMKRRPILYIVNFMLPIMLFFGLDLASFLISDYGGEKLSFKVTVLLAVTVMQLILNEILPSSSDRIPLIAVYCIGIFGLMMLSLLETILVMYLIERDNEPTSLFEDCKGKCSKVRFQNCFKDVKTCIPGACMRDVSRGETSSELLAATKEGSSNQLMEESHDFEKVSDELREVVKTLTLILESKKEEGKHGYWTKMATTIDRVFLVFHVTAAAVFLIYMHSCWTEEENELR